jgi:hypothetical protein
MVSKCLTNQELLTFVAHVARGQTQFAEVDAHNDGI